MQLKKFQEYTTAYLSFLSTQEAEAQLYKWESQRVWQNNWNVTEIDLATTYNRSLENSTTRRLWYRERFEPKRMMLTFLRFAPDFVREIFKDLFAEHKDLAGRTGRFIFHCDQLLADYKNAHPAKTENNHYHDDYEMISLYLAFQYPDQYTLYNFDLFQTYLRKLEARDIPQNHDFERFTKVMRTTQKLLSRETALLEAHQARLRPEHYPEESLLLAHDFMCFVVGT